MFNSRFEGRYRVRGTRRLAGIAALSLVLAALMGALPVAAGEVSLPGVPTLPDRDLNPEGSSGFEHRDVVHARHYMASAANPLATAAGVDILAAGGSAADAAIAIQLVLNLVEPQSSGLGGGGFIVSYDAGTGQVQAWDGRETAPGAARAGRFLHEGSPMAFADAVNSGKAVGTPGLLRVLALLHTRHGMLPWADLFQPAIQLAENGFPVSRRLHQLLQDNDALRDQPRAAAYFYDAQKQALPVGHILKNAALAAVLRDIAAHGPDIFYTGPVAENMVAAVQEHAVPGDLTMADLAAYQAMERQPLCTPYKVYVLCGMPPPSSGPLAVMQMLGILTHTPIAELEPDSLLAVHYFSEAGRLAFADRDAYVADPDFVDVPVHGLLDEGYLSERAGLIQAGHSLGIAAAGRPAGAGAIQGADDTPELASTTHIVTADVWGNVVSMTSSIESAFGSKIFVDGFLLNNELTDFSLSDTDTQGRALANRVQPYKRPRSSMAPMLVLKDGRPIMAIGSPGGSAIINYVAKTLLGVLDWKLDIQEAIALPNRGSRNRYTEVEKNTPLTGLSEDLRRMGHEVVETEFPSGLQGMVFTPAGIEGGSDPRREGRSRGR